MSYLLTYLSGSQSHVPKVMRRVGCREGLKNWECSGGKWSGAVGEVVYVYIMSSLRWPRRWARARALRRRPEEVVCIRTALIA